MRKYLPAFSLILIAVLVAEVLPGSAPMTQPALLPFIVLIYGPGALLIRDVARARSLGWTSILLFGAAYGILEEGIALQSLFNPALYHAARWGRVGGINIVYAEAVIPIHAIWSAAVPILLTDLLFPEQRQSPFFGRLGRILTGVWYLLGLTLLALLTRLSIAPGFWARPALLLTSGALALTFILVALGLSPITKPTSRRPPGLLPTFLTTVAMALVWHFLLAGLWRFRPQFATRPLMLAPMLLAAALLLAAYRCLSARVAAYRWTDQHWFSLAAGLVTAHMLFGILIFAQSWLDRIATVALGAAFLTTVYRQLTRRLDPTLRFATQKSV